MDEAKRQRKLVREVLYPYILENSENIADTQAFLSGLDQVIKMAFNNQMMSIKISELKLGDYMVDKGMDKAKAILEILKDESVLSATILIGALPKAIEMVLKDESKKRSLKEIDIEKLLND